MDYKDKYKHDFPVHRTDRRVYGNIVELQENLPRARLSYPKGYVSLGIRPSGELHVGTIATLVNGFILSDLIDARGIELTVCDNDQPDAKEPGHRQHYDILYNRLQDPERCHETIAEHGEEEIIAAALSIRDAAEQKFDRAFSLNIMKLSDVTSILEFRAELMGLLVPYEKARYLKSLSLGWSKVRAHRNKVYKHRIFIPCQECGTTPHAPSLVTFELEGGSRVPYIHGAAGNYDCNSCKNGKVLKPLSNLEQELAVHHFFDPIRDVCLPRYNDPDRKVRLHVFGGDYIERYYSKHLTPAQIIFDIVELTGRETPDIFLGPTYVDLNGNKLSKRRTYQLERDWFNPLPGIIDFISVQEMLLEAGISRISPVEIFDAANLVKWR